ncbi:hypothetical protein, partial [Burkholderia cenocepacia]|uniref:hypothetical protein n=1 Tax=Burkholderia cenocepacia TaxID=95486 RepID=UPI0022377407
INAIVSLFTTLLLPLFIAPTYDIRPADRAKDATDIGQRTSILEYLRIPGFTLKRAWCSSLVVYGVVTFCTLFVRSIQLAIALIGIAGFTWAMTLWAPFAIISAEVSRRDATIRARKAQAAELRADQHGQSQSDSEEEE